MNAIVHVDVTNPIAEVRNGVMARATGVSAKAAGTRATAHVSRNKVAYIAGRLGAAGAVGLERIKNWSGQTLFIKPSP